LTAAHVAHLARLAAERETTISALVREALDAHHGPPPPLSIPDNPRQPKLFTQWRV
jgi:hypothetical protein